MSTVPRRSAPAEVYYPDSDGEPLGETPRHSKVTYDTYATLAEYFAADPKVFVAADIFLYYVEGNPRKHVSPDVFLVRGVPSQWNPERRVYLLWEEKKSPDFVLEVTSKSTRAEDMVVKMRLYQDVLKVREYFLLDPFAEYLDPPLRGYRLWRGRYVPVKPVRGRLPSKVLGLHLERDGWELRLYDPRTKERVLQAPEKTARAEAAAQAAEAVAQAAEAAAQAAEEERRREQAARQRAEAEAERLRRELEALRRRSP